MDKINHLNKGYNEKDIKKGQKIAGALYLITHHLSDNDPLKNALRTHAVTISNTSSENAIATLAPIINSLLDTAVIAQLVSEKNASIISLELRHYTASLSEYSAVNSLFNPVFDNDLSYKYQPIKITNPSKILISNENKSKRQDAILSFINERTSVGIKDIAALFSDTSEKTIQRELGTLVSAGKITKRGEKRWSVYMKL